MQIIPKISKGRLRRLARRYHRAASPIEKVRTLIVIQLARGLSSVDIERAGTCVRSTVSYVGGRYRVLGELGLPDGRRGNGKPKASERLLFRLRTLLGSSPQTHGWMRPTWTRELLVRQLEADTGVRISLATVSYCLAKMGARWGRPKLYVECPWPAARRRRRLAQLRRLVAELPPDEVAFYQDEVDIHLNPRPGPDWTLPGYQHWVRTPGKNEKRYVAGALQAHKGRLIWVSSDRKASGLFIALVDKVARRHAKARRIHLIVDNYSIHDSKLTREAVARHGGRVVLHFLPPYCPDHNPIERLWQHLHANVTRNHRCHSIERLLQEVDAYLTAAQPFPGSKPSLRRAA